MGMGGDEVGSIEKLERHLALLKVEYTKLQRNYVELERKYNEIVASTEGESAEFSSFVSRLALTASSLYGRSMYSDLNIKTNANGTLIPAHKFVLHARSEKWQNEVLASTNLMDWSDLEEDIATALLRWIYTDIVDLQHDRLTLGLLKVAHQFSLPALLGLCERALVASVGVRSCVRFYCVAEEVGATALLEYCSGIISTHWDDLTPQDFEYMSGPLLFKMLKSKTKHPLHAAIRLLREDVVFLCLVENDTVLPKLVNSLSENGQLPLQMALSLKNIQIAQTLVKNGCANVNAYDANGSTLLIDAVKKSDNFAADFLLSQNCIVDNLSRPSSDTALHIICSYGRSNCDQNDFSQMLDIGRKILQCNPNVNIQNIQGQTPLHIAIISQNLDMVNLLLDVPNIDVNLRTTEEKSPLELSLNLFEKEGSGIASKLLQMGAQPNPLKAETNDSLLQTLILQGSTFENAAVFLADFAIVDHINNNGMTALHLAAKHNMPILVTKLLHMGASANIQSSKADMKSPLHVAVEASALQVIKVFSNFRKDGATPLDYNCKDSNGDSPLSLCLALNQMKLASLLIAGGADVNARNDCELTLFHQCILNGNDEKAIFLLEQGADINALTGEQKSGLQLSIDNHLPKVVDMLCTKGVDLGVFNKNGDSPLWTSLELGFEDVAQILIRHGIDTDCWSQGPEGCQQTLLHRAIDENKESIAMFLVQNQCDLDSPRQLGPNGEGSDEARDKASPLHLCCQWGLSKVVQALIDHGANVNSLDIDNKSPVHIAIENQHEDIINILLCHPGIDLKVRDKLGLTPFAASLAIRNHKAAQRILERLPNAAEIMDQRGRNFLHVAILKDDLESVLFLLAIVVDVNSRVHDAYQSTPLHLAAASKNEMIIRNLILAGARINERDAVQKMPLHIAIERGNISAVSAMIQNNADFDATDADGNNALHLAVHGGQLAIVRELLTESRVNAEAINAKGRNPLHELCRLGEDNTGAAICELFLECMPKFPINVPDMDGNTPLLLAYMRGQSPLCKVLVKVGACLGAQNREGISIFNFKLATDQLLSKLLDQLPKESPWSESELCQECGSKFSLTMRKHHCRHCGRVLCSKCSNNDVPILKFGINKPVRVCHICFDVIQGGGVESIGNSFVNFF
ncbi:rabankyrin-5 [Drosophila sulfurigaster albostrigata]|uniref:rabankyrin-5 n=1 Tax=Drosophila sulfurigaster albostrigata TaxID=89887 RepID=UPI002D21B313|nr:rabankyrin-5 [Drosophila sulfurigaster albostrigata]